MFQINDTEVDILVSQNVIPSNQIIQKHDKNIKEIFSVINYLTESQKENISNKEETRFRYKK